MPRRAEIQPRQLEPDAPILHEHLARHHGRPHVVSSRHIDEMGHGVEHRRHAGRVGRDRNQIGLLSGFEAADAIAHAQGFRHQGGIELESATARYVDQRPILCIEVRNARLDEIQDR